MNSSGITGTDNFVMQDATQLIKNTGLRRVAGAITDVAALGERAILGHGRPSVSADGPSVGRNDLVCTCGKPRAERRTGPVHTGTSVSYGAPCCRYGPQRRQKKPRKRKNNKKIKIDYLVA